MLNAVKHLSHVVEWTRCHDAAETLWQAQFATTRHFKYSALLLGLLTAYSSKAQTYTIKTLEGATVIITVHDYSNKTLAHLTISCLSNKLELPVYYWNPREAKVLNDKFLQIRYHKRAGSDMSLANVLLVCVSHGKLQRAMHIESRFSEIQYVSGQDYKHWVQKSTDAKLAVDTKAIAHITVYDSLVYEAGAGRNDFTVKKYAVQFDTARRIFYNYQKQASFTLNSYDYKTSKFGKRYFSGIAPAFKIGEIEYIFIGRNWYTKGWAEKEYSLVD